MKLPISLAIFAGLSLTSSMASSFPQSARVDSVQIAGTGCSPQAVASDRLLDGYRIRTPSYTIRLSPSDRFVRNNCQAIVDIRKPRGWTYRVRQIELTGNAQLSGRAEGTISNDFYFQGEARTATAEAGIPLNFRNNFRYTNSVDGTWAPCNVDRALNVNTALVLRRSDGATGTGTLRINPSTRLWLEWRQC